MYAETAPCIGGFGMYLLVNNISTKFNANFFNIAPKNAKSAPVQNS
jgi:hypothetical protein